MIPASLRRRLGIKVGDRLTADIKGGSLVFSPQKKDAIKTRIIKDPVSGFPVLDSGKDAPVLTSEMVRDMLADFP